MAALNQKVVTMIILDLRIGRFSFLVTKETSAMPSRVFAIEPEGLIIDVPHACIMLTVE